MTLTDKKLEKAIGNIDKVIVIQDRLRSKRLELRNQLLRMQRAIKPTFWLDETNWKKMSFKEKLKLMRESKGIQIPQQDNFNTREFPFYAKKQYEKDRKQLIKEGKINV